MNWALLLPLLITATVAIGGWVVVHGLTVRRDRANKRRELITQYLVEAYRRLERATGRDDPRTMYDVNAWVCDLETSIADIQLFGTPKQVTLIQKFAIEFNSNFRSPEGVSLDELLADLRRELRKELGLEPVPNTFKFLRLSPRQPDDPKILSE